MSNLADLNDRAQESFNNLKKKFKLNQLVDALPVGEQIRIKEEAVDCEKIEQVIGRTRAAIDYSHTSIKEEATEREEFVDNSFNFIESLNLPSQLSLAIGYIISASKTKKSSELGRAISAIQLEGSVGDYNP